MIYVLSVSAQKITLNDTAACEEGLLIIQLGANEKLRSERSGDGKERMESRWSLKEARGARARCRWDQAEKSLGDQGFSREN